MPENTTGGPIKPPYGPKNAPTEDIPTASKQAFLTPIARKFAARRTRPANAVCSATLAAAKEMTERTAHDIRRQFGTDLTRDECLKLVSVFRAGVVPRRRAGRRPKPQVTAAYLDWKAGMRGVALFRKHIPGWDKHNRYHRIGEQKELMDAIRSRRRRERGKGA
jgi:hypothetical protein